MTERFVGKAIAALREQRDMTQEELAGRSGAARNTIAQLERGRDVPSVSTLCRLAEGLGMKAWQILQYADRLQLINETPFQPYQVESLATRKQAA